MDVELVNGRYFAVLSENTHHPVRRILPENWQPGNDDNVINNPAPAEPPGGKELLPAEIGAAKPAELPAKPEPPAKKKKY